MGIQNLWEEEVVKIKYEFKLDGGRGVLDIPNWVPGVGRNPSSHPMAETTLRLLSSQSTDSGGGGGGVVSYHLLCCDTQS